MIGFRVYKLYRTDRLTVHLSGLLWLAFRMVSRLWLPKVHEIDIQHLLTNRSLQVVAKISTEVNKSGWSQFCTFLCPRLCRTGSRLNQEWIRKKWVIKRFLLRSIWEAAKATEWTICLFNLAKIQPFDKIEKTCDNFQVNVLTMATCFTQCPRRKLNQATGSDERSKIGTSCVLYLFRQLLLMKWTSVL